MDGDNIEPRELEILPIKLVQTALQKGLLDRAALSRVGASTGKSGKKQTAIRHKKFSKDAVNVFNRAASLFVLYITTIAQDIAKTKKRATVYEADILEALKSCLFWEIEREMSEEMAAVNELMKRRQAQILREQKQEADADTIANEDQAAEADDAVDMHDEEHNSDIDAADVEELEEGFDYDQFPELDATEQVENMFEEQTEDAIEPEMSEQDGGVHDYDMFGADDLSDAAHVSNLPDFTEDAVMADNGDVNYGGNTTTPYGRTTQLDDMDGLMDFPGGNTQLVDDNPPGNTETEDVHNASTQAL
ncbi:CCAAT-binding transcription factor [Babesia ovata]|uniref:CCAAT-binding transcription factor n=1 Tax=Babesia ovata TaxID=189622 RepID=A0A2H6KFB9_9APIC|nr:CCAAT-binding transcription factor [Babesia ovata]GBE61691.1 CCAAT-binding transcription factor [Babesia ovata]